MSGWISAGAAIGGALISGGMGSSAAKKAASDQKKVAIAQMNMILNQQNQGRNNLQPFVNTGDAANSRLADMLGISTPKGYAQRPTRDQAYNDLLSAHYAKYGQGLHVTSDIGQFNNSVEKLYNERLANWEQGLNDYQAQEGDYSSDYGSLLKPFTNEDFEKEPGYQFRLDEGLKGIDRAASARGGYDSGATLKALNRYNQDYASNEFMNAYNRDSNNKGMAYNFLSGTANSGQNAASTLSGLGANAANSAANAYGQGNQLASQYQVQGAQAWNDAIQGGIANSLYALRTAQTAPVTGTGYTGGSSSIYGSGGNRNMPAWYLS